jgi:hypothetical protein
LTFVAAAAAATRGEQWSYLRGGLTSLDRDYGIFNKIHHNIETHVVHHLVSSSAVVGMTVYRICTTWVLWMHIAHFIQSSCGTARHKW